MKYKRELCFFHLSVFLTFTGCLCHASCSGEGLNETLTRIFCLGGETGETVVSGRRQVLSNIRWEQENECMSNEEWGRSDIRGR